MSKRSSEVQAQNINNFWKRMDFSTFQKVLRKWCELLEAHNGRDKVIRITGFTCTLISDFPVNSLERGILKSLLILPFLLGCQRHTSVKKDFSCWKTDELLSNTVKAV